MSVVVDGALVKALHFYQESVHTSSYKRKLNWRQKFIPAICYL